MVHTGLARATIRCQTFVQGMVHWGSAVKRNTERFPSDFVFQLRRREMADLRSQFVTLKPRRGQHRKYLAYAFTEHGAIMSPQTFICGFRNGNATNPLEG